MSAYPSHTVAPPVTPTLYWTRLDSSRAESLVSVNHILRGSPPRAVVSVISGPMAGETLVLAPGASMRPAGMDDEFPWF